MNKYFLLFAFNIPFVAYGYLKTYIYWESGRSGRLGIFSRLVFWTAILLALIFAQNIYNFLISNNITNSPPLNLADVVLATACNFNLFIIIRQYGRIDVLETKLTQLVTNQALDETEAQKR